jgi:hypothetical protein
MVQDLKVGMPEVRWMVLEPLDRDQLDPTSTYGDLPRMLQVWYALGLLALGLLAGMLSLPLVNSHSSCCHTP